MRKILLLIISVSLSIAFLKAQAEVELVPEGIVVPRTTPGAIASPVKGHIIYNTDTDSYWYHDGSTWQKVGTKSDQIIDNDGDTKIELIEGAGDLIFVSVDGLVQASFRKDHFQLIHGNSNIHLGFEVADVSTGFGNNFLGYQAGKRNTTGSANCFYGRSAGANNTSGDRNCFIGFNAGVSNETGDSTIAIGVGAAQLDSMASKSVYLGDLSGFGGPSVSSPKISREGNVFIGHQSGKLETNSNRLYIENSDAGPDSALIYGQFDVDKLTFNADVGIGTSNPGQILELSESKPDGETVILQRNSATASVNNTVNVVHRVNSLGPSRVTLKIKSSLNDISSTTPNSLVHFQTFNSGAFVNAISLNGEEVGIGTASPDDKLDVNGDMRVGSGTTGCVMDADGTVIAGTCSSDQRFKKDIVPLSSLLNRIASLTPVNYKWRSKEYPDKAWSEETQLGFIAQDVEEVLPQLVVQDEDGYKQLRYHQLPILSIQAIKELKEENDVLKTRIARLEKLVQDFIRDNPVGADSLHDESLSTKIK